MLGLVRKLRRSSSASTSSSRSGTGGEGGALQVATLLLKDGTVRDYTRRMRCGEVLAEYPGSRGVCPARAVLLKQAGQVLLKDAHLELGTIYFLLANDNGGTSSTSGAGAGAGVKFVITRDYVARIMEDAGAGHGAPVTSGLKRSDTPAHARDRHHYSLPSAKRARSRQSHWVASLTSRIHYPT